MMRSRRTMVTRDDHQSIPEDSTPVPADESTPLLLHLDEGTQETEPIVEEPAVSPEFPKSTRHGSMGAWLVGLGGVAWLTVAALRCPAPPEAPPLTVSESSEEPETPPSDTRPKAPPPTPSGPTSPTEAEPPDGVETTPARPKTPASWATDPVAPSQITYTIRRGGAIENVANLYKIYHHEITALNPSYTLDQALPPSTEVVVWRPEPGETSESVGYPSAGSLEGGVPMLFGAGRLLKMIPWKSWGTAHTVALLDRVLDQWAKRGDVQPILVGNMSSRNGGNLEPHSTHQSGRDVDLGYVQKLPPGEELNWRHMTETNLDAGETWALLFLLVQTAEVEVIFIDRTIQKLLYDAALRDKRLSKRQLAEWMEYPRPTGSGDPLIQHVNGHVDHLHVRFRCQSHEKRCQSH